MNLKIEPISEEDFVAMLSLFQEFADFQDSSDKMTNSINQMMQDKDLIQGYTAKDENNVIVGYATYFFAYYTWSGKSIYMDDLYITEQYRRKGLGTQLIQKVISSAKSQNCKRLRWQVGNWNSPAIKFYEQLGARIDSTEMNCDIIL